MTEFLNRVSCCVNGRDDRVCFRHKVDDNIHTLMITINGANFTVRSDNFDRMLELMTDISKMLDKKG